MVLIRLNDRDRGPRWLVSILFYGRNGGGAQPGSRTNTMRTSRYHQRCRLTTGKQIMCFSASEWADYRHFVRTFGAIMSIGEYVRLFSDRARGAKIKVPKAMTDAFADPKTDQERQAKALIAEFDVAQAGVLEQELFKQKKRLADAERVLAGPKPTKKATEDRRIANQKIPDIQAKLTDLHRTEPKARDSRIFPDSYASVMLMRDGKRVVMPMRYHCRPEGMPASIDRTKDGRVSGTYNA